ncbi:MAG: sulfurtransferase TusA [Pseudomonadota bacterium]
MPDPNTTVSSLDARGLRCPEPVMLMHQAIRKMASGDTLTVFATDPSTQRDVAQFCRHLGHELLKAEERQSDDGSDYGREYVYVVRKGGSE